jgi:hypothetical protein
MYGANRKAAEQRELAAAAEHKEKGEYTAAIRHPERALECSDHGYQAAKEAHTKSGEIRSL